MNSQDFQIGDYVLINNVVRKVELITKKKIGYHKKDRENVMHYSRICNIKPILITEDLLKKFELNKSTDLIINEPEWISKDKRVIIHNINTDDIWYVHIDSEDFQTIGSVEFSYVHELQHIIKLTKNKSIKLILDIDKFN